MAARTSASDGRAAGSAGRDPARLEDVIALRGFQREADVLFDQQHTEVAALGQRGDRGLDLGDHRRLDAFGRLVEDQAPGGGDQRACDRQLLALSSRQQARPPREKFLQRREQVELLIDELLAVLAAVGDDLKVLGRRQLAERLLPLRHVGEAARHACARPELGDFLPVEKHLARTAFQQADGGAQQRGLACPVVTHDRGHPVGRHLDADAVDDLGASISGMDFQKLQHQELSSMSSSGIPSTPAAAVPR